MTALLATLVLSSAPTTVEAPLPLTPGVYVGKTTAHVGGFVLSGRLNLEVVSVRPDGTVKAIGTIPGEPGQIKFTGKVKPDGTLTLTGKSVVKVDGQEATTTWEGEARVSEGRIKGRFETETEFLGQTAPGAVDFDLKRKAND